ncbi:hypothetical protein GOODEAATRI_008936 [Goodea atripinnis]|uniref:Uncharacterized protein n=1 Tax=Goodea atripinnis TaxID=208336 RepID=A0ABV0PCM7_9TELE
MRSVARRTKLRKKAAATRWTNQRRRHGKCSQEAQKGVCFPLWSNTADEAASNYRKQTPTDGNELWCPLTPSDGYNPSDGARRHVLIASLGFLTGCSVEQPLFVAFINNSPNSVIFLLKSSALKQSFALIPFLVNFHD